MASVSGEGIVNKAYTFKIETWRKERWLDRGPQRTKKTNMSHFKLTGQCLTRNVVGYF